MCPSKPQWPMSQTVEPDHSLVCWIDSEIIMEFPWHSRLRLQDPTATRRLRDENCRMNPGCRTFLTQDTMHFGSGSRRV